MERAFRHAVGDRPRCGEYNFGRHTVGANGGGQHAGLYSQEMLLYFLVMELGVCQDDVPGIE